MSKNFRVLSWQEAREKVLALNPGIVAIIDQLDPPKHLKLYHLTLPYGYEFLQKGVLNFENLNIPKEHIPNISSMGILLTKQLEFYIDIGDRTLPYAIISPGNLFGGWAHLLLQNMKDHYHPWFLWNLSSGARSLFFLSKIADQEALDRLKKVYPFEAWSPKQSNQQWHLFRELARYEDSWAADIILFDKAWFNYTDDLRWAGFYFYAINDIGKRQGFLVDFLRWQIIFSSIHEKPGMKYPSYILDTIKHIFAIGVGGMPGFVPMLGDESAPVSFLQRIFQDVYQLEYLPVMMGLGQFSKMNALQQPIYYSLHYPLAMDYSPKLVGSTNVKTLIVLEHVLKRHLQIFADSQYEEMAPNLHHFSKQLRFDLFHAKSAMPESGILSGEAMIEQDPRFTQGFSGGGAMNFPYNTSFLNGCIRIRWD